MPIKNPLVYVLLFTSLLQLQGCGGGGTPDTPVTPPDTVTPDTTPPVITVNGEPSVNHEQGTEYLDAGATANDNVDGDVTVSVSGTVGSDAGTYTLTFTASDTAGNSSSVNHTVIVADTQPPVITLEGAEQMELAAEDTYVEPGATAVDLVDGQVEVVVTGTVGATPGSYTLTYSATDAAGNSAEITRRVTVSEPQLPPDDVDVPDETDLMVLSAGGASSIWDKGITAFDAGIGFAECNNDGGAACPNIAWQVVADNDRGNVLEVSHADSGELAGLYVGTNTVVDLRDYSEGNLVFDVKVISGDSKITMKLDCIAPCTSGEQQLGNRGDTGWETVTVSMNTLVNGGLDLANVSTGLVIWATDTTSTVFRLDNVRFTGLADGATPPTVPVDPGSSFDFNLTSYGAGNISDTINPAGYRCVVDHGNWIYNAGVVEPAIDACNASTGIPTGTPTTLSPHLTGAAADKPTATHKWWGSIPFMGEMTVGDVNDAAYITPDPITARITDKGVRMMGLPGGIRVVNHNEVAYPIPAPFDELFDGIAIANSEFADLEGFLKDHSDGSVTVEWQSNGEAVMEATFVHGSPYVYFTALQGDLVLRTLRADSGEKGSFYQQDNSLGVWTSVAGNHNNFLITGEGETQFSAPESNEITITNAAKAITVTYLPQINGVPDDTLSAFFASKARDVVQAVNIDYSVDQSNNEVTITHRYLNANGEPIETLAGMHPLHWKHSTQTTSDYQIRSARGMIKFAQTSQFSYQIPYNGVLPTLPVLDNSLDLPTLEALINELIEAGESEWNTFTDTYWSGKRYARVAEVIAIAQQAGFDEQAGQLRTWLKSELEDWFTANTTGDLDINKYFVYDQEWSTLLGLEESFLSHQQLNDHHFHYGYFVRAAAEICRTEPQWCGDEQYGPMIELLIRDYAGGRDDEMFPYLRNFDPANGFSWASGKVNFIRGNNNESTSEAANAYGAIILYGMLTDDQALIDRGIYLHASTSASYWQYWNNIDGYRDDEEDNNNFLPGYERITTSIIWGDGAVFSTWFSGAFAHILGIQGLPINPLVLHVGLHDDYMADYVTLGLSESSNGKPSGLPEDQWRDVWWNLWAMTDATSALADYNAVSGYNEEAGESKAHTYHWLHTYNTLGTLISGDGTLSADYPAAAVFQKGEVRTYVVYNFSGVEKLVTFSDDTQVTATPQGFTLLIK